MIRSPSKFSYLSMAQFINSKITIWDHFTFLFLSN